MNSPQNNDNFIHAPINTFYVAEDGNWGQGDVILFDRDALTEKQWDLIENLEGETVFDYIHAIYSNDQAEVEQIEADYAD